MKRDTQEMETAASRKFYLPLSPLRRFYLFLRFLLCTTHNSKSHTALLKIRYKNFVQIFLYFLAWAH